MALLGRRQIRVRPKKWASTPNRTGRNRSQVFFCRSRSGGLSKPLRDRNGGKDLLMSWMFQTCIKLQTSLDRRFLRFGMTVQEASVLLRCVEARNITPGQLAVGLGRDKGMITRFIDRLEFKPFDRARYQSARPQIFGHQTHSKGKTDSSGLGARLPQDSKRTLCRNVGERCPSVKQGCWRSSTRMQSTSDLRKNARQCDGAGGLAGTG